jgi:hypothetical protein
VINVWGSGLSIVVLWIYTSNIPSTLFFMFLAYLKIQWISVDGDNSTSVQDKMGFFTIMKRYCMSRYCSDDFRPALWNAASALLWNICMILELHGKLQKQQKLAWCCLSNLLSSQWRLLKKGVTPSLSLSDRLCIFLLSFQVRIENGN